MVAASGRDALVWSLTPGQAGDGPEGRQLIEAMGHQDAPVYLLMDSAYEGDETRAAAIERNFIPVVPANPKRKQPWPLDKLFTESDGGKQLFITTSDELERAGYAFELFGYCFGWLTYKGERRPVVCDAPVMEMGSQDRPITFDSGTGQWSNGTGRKPSPPPPADFAS